MWFFFIKKRNQTILKLILYLEYRIVNFDIDLNQFAQKSEVKNFSEISLILSTRESKVWLINDYEKRGLISISFTGDWFRFLSIKLKSFNWWNFAIFSCFTIFLICTKHFHEKIEEFFFALTAHAIVVVTSNAVHLLLPKFHFLAERYPNELFT